MQTAIHATAKKRWSDCIEDDNWYYDVQLKYYDMSDTVVSILTSNPYKNNNMRLMFYNGDIDTICQFLGDQWFIEALATRLNLTVNKIFSYN